MKRRKKNIGTGLVTVKKQEKLDRWKRNSLIRHG